MTTVGASSARYREPFGGTARCFAVLPLDRVEPTPYQRDPSDAHVKRLMTVIEKIGSFLDPIIAIRKDDGYWTPNGNHRLQALKKLGVKSITALVLPDAGDRLQDPRAQHREGAQPAREVARGDPHGARARRTNGAGTEADHAFEFEQPSLLTLGICYEERPRLSGGAYQSMLRRIDEFLDEPLRDARSRSGSAAAARSSSWTTPSAPRSRS